MALRPATPAGLPPLLLLPLALLLAAAQSVAEEMPWYDVELIVFTNPLEQTSELWPENTPTPPEEGTHLTAAAAKGKSPTPYRRLSAEELRLNNKAEKIAAAKNHQLLLHIGWRQPGRSSEETPMVYLTSEVNANASEKSDGEEETAPAAAALLGQARLIRSRFLHLEFNLLYREEVEEPVTLEALAQPADQGLRPLESSPPSSPGNALLTPKGSAGENPLISGPLAEPLAGGPPLYELAIEPQGPHYQGYLLNESRKIRSGELHYFDHPRFGVLALVTPYSVPKADEAAGSEGGAEAAP